VPAGSVWSKGIESTAGGNDDTGESGIDGGLSAAGGEVAGGGATDGGATDGGATDGGATATDATVGAVTGAAGGTEFVSAHGASQLGLRSLLSAACMAPVFGLRLGGGGGAERAFAATGGSA
jgi:hypothetical protein